MTALFAFLFVTSLWVAKCALVSKDYFPPDGTDFGKFLREYFHMNEGCCAKEALCPVEHAEAFFKKGCETEYYEDVPFILRNDFLDKMDKVNNPLFILAQQLKVLVEKEQTSTLVSTQRDFVRDPSVCDIYRQAYKEALTVISSNSPHNTKWNAILLSLTKADLACCKLFIEHYANATQKNSLITRNLNSMRDAIQNRIDYLIKINNSTEITKEHEFEVMKSDFESPEYENAPAFDDILRTNKRSVSRRDTFWSAIASVGSAFARIGTAIADFFSWLFGLRLPQKDVLDYDNPIILED